MDEPVVVRIFGVPTACATGMVDAWRDVARWVATQLKARFGERVAVEYCDLFSDEAARFPPALAMVREHGASIPLVFVGDELVCAGGKVSIPAIRERLEALGLRSG